MKKFNICFNYYEEIEDFNFQSNYIYLTTVSRISYEKNIEEMVKIISRINCNINFKLLIIGDGPRLDCVKQTVSKLNLDEKLQSTERQKSIKTKLSTTEHRKENAT